MLAETVRPWVVLASLGLLLVLLVRGRQAPAMLFATWATSYLLFGLIDQATFLAGFANPALATLLILMMVSQALERTPLLSHLGDALLQGTHHQATRRLSATTLIFSAFLNNTAVVAALLSMVTRQQRIAASRLLIPLSYASILGGITTLVGTSTNLVVNSFVVGAGLPALEMFQFAWVGLPTALLSLLALLAVSRLLPARERDSAHTHHPYFLEARVMPGSPLVGKSVEENRLRRLDGLFLAEILRDGHLISPVAPDALLQADDTLIFSGATHNIQALQAFPGLALLGGRADEILTSNLVEVIITSESDLAGRTLREVDFRALFDAAVVGIRRGRRHLTGQLGQTPLRVGDSLLLAVGKDFRQRHNLARNFHVLGNSLLRPRLDGPRHLLAVGGFTLAILLATLNVLPLLHGLLALLLLLLASGSLSAGDLRRRFPFELLLMVGSALAIAATLRDSGAADLLARSIHQLFGNTGPWAALAGIYLMTVLLTEVLTNNAAAAMAFPIALSTARSFGVDPLPFVMVVAYGASACFLLPFGYQTHLMVYSPGSYRLQDFVRTGLPVSLVYATCVLTLVPRIFPF